MLEAVGDGCFDRGAPRISLEPDAAHAADHPLEPQRLDAVEPGGLELDKRHQYRLTDAALAGGIAEIEPEIEIGLRPLRRRARRRRERAVGITRSGGRLDRFVEGIEDGAQPLALKIGAGLAE